MEYVVITKEEYESLLSESRMYQRLVEFGVDNWNGYSDASDFVDEFEENNPIIYEPFTAELSILLQPFIEL
jgi:hypothetical protein